MKDYMTGLSYLAKVVEEGSFTRAAAQLGISQPALSYAVKQLEKQLDVRLLNRTTRSVAPTPACEVLLSGVNPCFSEIERQIDMLVSKESHISGTVRINLGEHPLHYVIWPFIETFLRTCPQAGVELYADNGMADIVSGRFDAGVRLGESLAKDMVALRLGPDWRMCVAGSPAYFEQHGIPNVPEDLHRHNCVNMRLPTLGGLYAWEFSRNGQQTNVRVEGQLTLNSLQARIRAAVSGLGLVFLPEDTVQREVEEGLLTCVLQDWCEPFSGYYLYYPSRKQHTPAFAKLLEIIREKTQ